MTAFSDLQNALSPDVLVGLTDDDFDGIADSNVIQAAIDAATRLVRSQTGLSGDLPSSLQDVVITFAVERLYERRREALPGPWRDRANRAREFIVNWNDGDAVRYSPATDERIAIREILNNL